MPLLLLLVACSPVRLSDDTRLAFDLFGAEPDQLASPYVVGAAFDVTLNTRGDPAGFTVTSADPDVLALGEGVIDRDDDDDARIVFPAVAAGVGSTTLVVRDPDGDEVATADARVAAPTRFELRSATQLEADPDAPAVDTPKVVVGGTAAFRVDFFDGTEALAGAGGLRAAAPASAVLEDESTFPDDADWIVVTPSAAGALAFDLTTGGEPAGTATLEAVDPAALTGIAIHRDAESGAEAGESLTIVAAAEDTAGDVVFGVTFTWAEDGVPVDAVGDVYRYDFDPDVLTTVVVSSAGAEETLEVHGRGGDVSDSDTVACAVANVAPIGTAILLALAGVVRRRRPRAAECARTAGP